MAGLAENSYTADEFHGIYREDGVEVVQMTEQMILDTVEYYAILPNF